MLPLAITGMSLRGSTCCPAPRGTFKDRQLCRVEIRMAAEPLPQLRQNPFDPNLDQSTEDPLHVQVARILLATMSQRYKHKIECGRAYYRYLEGRVAGPGPHDKLGSVRLMLLTQKVPPSCGFACCALNRNDNRVGGEQRRVFSGLSIVFAWWTCEESHAEGAASGICYPSGWRILPWSV
jgi:hypothetical protein